MKKIKNIFLIIVILMLSSCSTIGNHMKSNIINKLYEKGQSKPTSPWTNQVTLGYDEKASRNLEKGCNIRNFYEYGTPEENDYYCVCLH